MFWNNTNLFSVLKNRKLNSVRLSKALSLEFIDDFFFFLVDFSNNTSSGLLDLRSVFHRCMYTSFTSSSLNKKYFKLHRIKYQYKFYYKKKKKKKKKNNQNNQNNTSTSNTDNKNNVSRNYSNNKNNIYIKNNQNSQYNKNNIYIKNNKDSQHNKYIKDNNIYNEYHKNKHEYEYQHSNNKPRKRRRRIKRHSNKYLTKIERAHMAKLSKRERISMFIAKRRERRETKNRFESASLAKLNLHYKYQFRFSFLSRFVKRKSSFFNVDRRRLIFRYFYNSLLLKSNMYSFYGNSMLVFSLRSVDLDIRLDIHGSSFLERILYKPVSSLFFLNV